MPVWNNTAVGIVVSLWQAGRSISYIVAELWSYGYEVEEFTVLQTLRTYGYNV